MVRAGVFVLEHPSRGETIIMGREMPGLEMREDSQFPEYFRDLGLQLKFSNNSNLPLHCSLLSTELTALLIFLYF